MRPFPVAAAERALRKGYEEGRRAYGDLPFPFEEYSRGVLDRAARRVERLAGAGTVEDVLERAVLGDLFLALACEAGAEGAWETLTARFEGVLLSLAIRRGASRGEAEEIAREVPGDLFAPPPAGGARTRLGTYDGSGSLQGWLAIIVQRRLADRRRVRPLAPLPEEGPAIRRDAVEEASDRETAGRFADALREAWRDLTPAESLALLLKYRDGIPQKEIARVLGVGEPRVSRVLAAATDRIRATVERRVGHSPDLASGDPGVLPSLLAAALAQSMATPTPPPDSPSDG